MHHLLSLLIIVPVVAALAALFIPSAFRDAFRLLALSVSLFQCVILYLLIRNYSPGPAFQFVESQSWITFDLGTLGTFQATYFLGLDGLGLTLISLGVLIILVAVLSSWSVSKNVKGYFVLLMILNGAVMGTFSALDLLLFYVFFEFMLLPMYFLIGIWGGPDREYASIKFFLYTLLGSILILVVLIGLYLSVRDPSVRDNIVHTFSMPAMTDPSYFISGSVLDPSSPWMIGSFPARQWAFLLLLVGFGIKLPIVPFHTWLPDAHVQAPTAISVILAALLLKIGAYGLLRLAYPVFPGEALLASWWVGLLGVVSILYGALNAMASKDLKRLIAYSSISHMGFFLLGIASGTVEGTTGAVFQLFSHGILTGLLFLLAGVLSDRTNDRMIDNYSGLATVMRSYTGIVLIAFFASMGFPGFSGFIGEVLIFLGAFLSPSSNGLLPQWMAFTATIGLLLTAAYYVWTLQRMFFGVQSIKVAGKISDLTAREYLMLLPLCAITLLLGIFPQPMLDVINPFAVHLIDALMKFKP